MRHPAKFLNWIILIVLCVSLLAGAWWWSRDAKPPGIEATTSENESYFPADFSFRDNLGKLHHIYDFKNKKIMIHFWATWCAPCVEEFPSLLARMAKTPDVTLIAISSDQEADTMNNFIKSLNVKTDLPNVMYVWDQDDVLAQQKFDINAYPETFVFEKNLNMTLHIRGSMDWDTLKVSE